MIENKKFEIFCGTGGVGKTTLASSRALYLANTGTKTLLITIDPSKRLKQVFGLDDENSGQVEESGFENLSIMLMNPRVTMERVLEKHGKSIKDANHIIDILSKPYAGMNEIFSMLEVYNQLESKKYDCIVLDTAPGKHFLDFLDSGRKINQFFNKTFVEIFQSLGKNITGTTQKSKAGKLFGAIVKTGINKLLSYLEKVTGESFVEDFTDALLSMYECREEFLASCRLSETLLSQNETNWFLVSSASQMKVKDAVFMQDSMNKLSSGAGMLLINKTLEQDFLNWKPENKSLKDLKEALVNRQEELLSSVSAVFSSYKLFKEKNSTNPLTQVKELSLEWNND